MSARILIIEDEALVAMELRFVLEDLGYEVMEARNGREGVEAYTELKSVAIDLN